MTTSPKYDLIILLTYHQHIPIGSHYYKQHVLPGNVSKYELLLSSGNVSKYELLTGKDVLPEKECHNIEKYILYNYYLYNCNFI